MEEETTWQKIIKGFGLFIVGLFIISLFGILIFILISIIRFYDKHGTWPDFNDYRGFFTSETPATPDAPPPPAASTNEQPPPPPVVSPPLPPPPQNQIYTEGETVHLSLTSLMGTFKPESDNIKVEFYPPSR